MGRRLDGGSPVGFVSLGSFIGGFFGVGGSFLFSEPAFVSLPEINCFLRLDQWLLIILIFFQLARYHSEDCGIASTQIGRTSVLIGARGECAAFAEPQSPAAHTTEIGATDN